LKKNSILKLVIIILILLFFILLLFLLTLLLYASSDNHEMKQGTITINNDINSRNTNLDNLNIVNNKNISSKNTTNENMTNYTSNRNMSNENIIDENASREKKSREKSVENIKYPIESEYITSIDTLLVNLKSKGMKFSSIEDELGEGIELENGYYSYLDGTVKIKKSRNNIVLNIIFSKDYKEQIFSSFENTDTLEDIYFFNSDNCYGSVEEGFLGYRTDKLYYFIYEDEISVYGYSYIKNTDFELALAKYIEDNNLEKFVNKTIHEFTEYENYDCDFSDEHAYINFSSYGLEFKINDNNSKGIILYNNYCFSSKTKQYVIDGLITFNNSENSIEKAEKERRMGKLEIRD